MIVLFRIDERLVHGQIAVAWSKTLKISHIVVANDLIVGQEMQKAALKMACPPDVKIAFKSVADVPGVVSDPRLADKRVMLVVKTPADALALVKICPGVESVNVGNCGFLGNIEGKKEFVRHIRLSDEDVEILKEIDTMVPVDLQVVPDEQKRLFRNVLKGE